MATCLTLLLLILRFFLTEGKPPDLSKRVVHAVNCGGQKHVGAYGIVYQEDQNPQGTASDYGSRWAFPNAHVDDRKLYETERYYDGELTYSFDIPKDGKYVIIMKFSEVYFNSPGEKVFHVHVNDIPVKRNMDIFKEVGAAGAAYDLYVDISVSKKELTIGDLIGDIDGELQIRLVPVNDNPKINAIAILTGTSETLPPPPPLVQQEFPQSSRRRSRKEVIDDDDEEEEEEEAESIEPSEPRAWQEPVREVASGPRTRNPFEDKNDNVFVYLGVTLVCLLPVVAFLMHM
ncbi:hypothetical protein Y032_0017g3393 [Ancylostoma ceylanicum]|uniref:Malectin domain-containing protein n=1 Tax=Ancylostoma ceylanicum TaxID=53326 RepID=A0A016V5I1_9BILA|nr:hypothetical protein Y032_0017g3393 [Ancylostoma ceylanicum]